MADREISSPGTRALAIWRKFGGNDIGRRIFSRLLAQQVPYSGSIRAVVQELRPGYCRVSMADRRALRNHLNSIHALALANLGELVSGLGMLVTLPPTTQGIVTRISTDYHKKARGPLIAESSSDVPSVEEPIEHLIQAQIKNARGEKVATVSVTWSLRPKTA